MKVYIEKRIKFLRRDRGPRKTQRNRSIWSKPNSKFKTQHTRHEGRPAGGREARLALCHDAHDLCRGEHAGLGHVSPDVAQEGFELMSGLTLVSYLSFYLNQIINLKCYYRQQAAEFSDYFPTSSNLGPMLELRSSGVTTKL